MNYISVFISFLRFFTAYSRVFHLFESYQHYDWKKLDKYRWNPGTIRRLLEDLPNYDRRCSTVTIEFHTPQMVVTTTLQLVTNPIAYVLTR